MRCRLPTALVTCLLCASAPARGGDLGRLRGTWLLRSLERHGKPQDPKQSRRFRLIVEGRNWIDERDGAIAGRSTIAIDPSRRPAEIDLADRDRPGVVVRGIYTFDGDTLVVCCAEQGRERPSRFVSTDDGVAYVMVLRRQRADEARGAEALVGLRVVTKPGATLKIGQRTGPKVIDDRHWPDPLLVERSQGDWLWLRSGCVAGWAYVEDIVPLDKALDYYDELTRRDPGRAWAYIGRGFIRLSRSDLDGALADGDAAVRLDPEDPVAHLLRGRARAARGEHERAILDYNALIRRRPGFGAAYLARGRSWAARGDQRRAADDFNAAIILDATDPVVVADAIAGRGEIEFARGEYDRALDDLSAAIKRDPKGARRYVGRARVWLVKGEYDQALADFDRAIGLDPRDPRAHAGRASILATCPDAQFRDGRGALESARRACELSGGKDAGHLATLAAALAEAEDFEAASDRQREALDLLPPDDPRREGFRARLSLFREGKPYRESPAGRVAGPGPSPEGEAPETEHTGASVSPRGSTPGA